MDAAFRDRQRVALHLAPGMGSWHAHCLRSTSSADVMNRRLVRNIAATVAVQVAVMVGTFAVYGLIARIFGPVAVGEYTIIRRALFLLQPFILAGLTVAVPRYLAMTADASQRGQIALVGVSAVLGCSCMTALLVVGSVDSLAEAMFGRADARELVYGFAVLTIAFGLHSVAYSYYRGIQEMRSANLLDLLNLGAVPLLAVALSLRSGIAEMIALTALSMIVVTVILAYGLWRAVWSSVRDGGPTASAALKLLAYGLPRIPGDLALAGLLFGGAYIVAREDGMEAAGHLGIAQTLLMLPGTALAALAVLLLPYVSERLASGDLAAVRHGSTFLFNALVDVTVYFALHVAVFSKPILALWLGSEMQGAAPLVSILALATPFYALYFVFRSVLDAATHRPITAMNLVLAFVSFVALYEVLAFAGINGTFAAAWALGGSFVVLGSLTMFWVAILVGLSGPVVRGVAPAFVANVLIAGLAYGALQWQDGGGTGNWLATELLCVSAFVAILRLSGRDWVITLRTRVTEVLRQSDPRAAR